MKEEKYYLLSGWITRPLERSLKPLIKLSRLNGWSPNSLAMRLNRLPLDDLIRSFRSWNSYSPSSSDSTPISSSSLLRDEFPGIFYNLRSIRIFSVSQFINLSNTCTACDRKKNYCCLFTPQTQQQQHRNVFSLKTYIVLYRINNPKKMFKFIIHEIVKSVFILFIFFKEKERKLKIIISCGSWGS